MGYSAILAQVKAVVSGVSGCGQVHDYDRYSTDWAEFLALFKSSAKINGWAISLAGIETRQTRTGEKDRLYIFKLRKYYGLQDSVGSGKVFDAHLEDVVEAFDNNETMAGTCNTTHPDWGSMSGSVGLQVRVIDIRMFGKVLCHYAEGMLAAEISL